MSIWHASIFGKRDKSPPANAVSIRCSRLAAAAGLDVLPWIISSFMVEWGLFMATMLVLVAVAAPTGTTMKMVIGSFAERKEILNDLLTMVEIGAFFAVAITLARPIGRKAFDYAAARATVQSQRRRRKHRRHGLKVVWALVLIVLLGGTAASISSKSPIFLLILIRSIEPAALMSLVISLKARRGRRLVCGRCDYPMGSWRGSGPRCPECNNSWHEPWQARIGQKHVNAVGVAVSLSLIALALASACFVGVLVKSA